MDVFSFLVVASYEFETVDSYAFLSSNGEFEYHYILPFLRKDSLLVRWLDGGELDRVKVVIGNRYPLLGLRKEVG